MLASLNHPGIAAIYGIEEQDGTRALVLELVEGPTLADRISKGPIPLDEALPIAKQIAEALEAAHEAGVIHRDLKPANIKVRKDGTVKVLDFGLAKALDPSPTDDPSQSPTLTVAATQMGMIVGTAAYMSPEQARGEALDKRADIWAFGCVLFEMLAGRRLFEGRTVSDTLASVLARDPDLDALPTDIPHAARRLLRRCLEKEPKQRLRDIAEGILQLDEGLAGETPEGADATVAVKASAQRVSGRWTLPWVVGVGLAAGLVGAVAAWSLTRPGLPSVVRFELLMHDGPSPFYVAASSPDIAISPSGDTIAYLSGDGGVRAGQLLVRRLAQLTSEVVAEGALNSPFFSADSTSGGVL